MIVQDADKTRAPMEMLQSDWFHVYPNLSTLFNFPAVAVLMHVSTRKPLIGGFTYLCSCPLSPNRHLHGMSPPSICTHIPQTPDVVLQFAPQIVFDGHVRKLGGQIEHLLVRQAPNSCCVVNIQL